MQKKILFILIGVLVVVLLVQFFMKPDKEEELTAPDIVIEPDTTTGTGSTGSGSTGGSSSGTGTTGSGSTSSSTTADTPAAIAARTDRANMLLKQFKTGYPKAKFLQAVNCAEVVVDAFNAIQTTGKTKWYQARAYDRGECFLQAVTKMGYLIFVDSAAKKLYSVNPHLLTLIY